MNLEFEPAGTLVTRRLTILAEDPGTPDAAALTDELSAALAATRRQRPLVVRSRRRAWPRCSWWPATRPGKRSVAARSGRWRTASLK
jgi:hypothetical protein